MPRITVIGAGPAGLIAAEILATAGHNVTVFDRMPSPGRKFLMAGRGGLNLTHSEPLDQLLTRYGPAQAFLASAVEAFPPAQLTAWCEGLGQPVFTGTSGRIFPTSFKASPLLRAWLQRLDALGVTFSFQHRWTGWDASALRFETPDGVRTVTADATLLALGGASWPRLGSDGSWVHLLEARGLEITPLRPANCGLSIGWSEIFRTRFAGHPVKSMTMTYQGHTVAGEVMITATGLEGTPVYALSGMIRDDLAAGHAPLITLDLRPGVSDMRKRLSAPRKRQSLSTFLQKAAGLPAPAIGLIHEVRTGDTPEELARLIHALPLRVIGTSGMERAISSAGGIASEEIDENFMLKKLRGVFAAGEMLDWEAPTGGYLLQASFSTGVAAAKGILKMLV